MNRKRVIVGSCIAVFLIAVAFLVISYSLLSFSNKAHIYHQETYDTICRMVNLLRYILIAAVVILIVVVVFCLLNKYFRKLAAIPLLLAIMLGCGVTMFNSKSNDTETVVLINAQVVQINNSTVTFQPNWTDAVGEQIKLYVTPAEAELLELYEHYGSVTYRSHGDNMKIGYLVTVSQ